MTRDDWKELKRLYDKTRDDAEQQRHTELMRQARRHINPTPTDPFFDTLTKRKRSWMRR